MGYCLFFLVFFLWYFLPQAGERRERKKLGVRVELRF